MKLYKSYVWCRDLLQLSVYLKQAVTIALHIWLLNKKKNPSPLTCRSLLLSKDLSPPFCLTLNTGVYRCIRCLLLLQEERRHSEESRCKMCWCRESGGGRVGERGGCQSVFEGERGFCRFYILHVVFSFILFLTGSVRNTIYTNKLTWTDVFWFSNPFWTANNAML